MKMKESRPFTVVGETEDGRLALAGVFWWVDTAGIPLDIIRLSFKDNNAVVALDYFVKEAREHGWKDKTIASKLRDADYPDDIVEKVLHAQDTTLVR